MIDNVASLEAHALSKLMMQERFDAYSDSGAIWLATFQQLKVALEASSDEVVAEAKKMASERWKRMMGNA